jgi:hypothetical protein
MESGFCGGAGWYTSMVEQFDAVVAPAQAGVQFG